MLCVVLELGSRNKQEWQRVCPQNKSRGILSPCIPKMLSQTRHSKTYEDAKRCYVIIYICLHIKYIYVVYIACFYFLKFQLTLDFLGFRVEGEPSSSLSGNTPAILIIPVHMLNIFVN